MPVQSRKRGSPSALHPYERCAFAAIEAASAEIGYANVSVAKIVSGAHMARGTFYKVFDGKEDCGRRAMVNAAGEAVERIHNASVGAPEPIAAGLSAILRLCDEKPHRARFFLVEGRATAGLAARYEAGMATFIEMLKRAAPHEVMSIHEMAIGGIGEIIYQRMQAGEPCVPLEAELHDFLLTPFR